MTVNSTHAPVTALGRFLCGAALLVLMGACSSDRQGLPVVDLDDPALEAPVREKLTQLQSELEREALTPERVGRLGVNLYVHDFKREAIAYFDWAAEREPDEVRWPYYAAIAREDVGDPEARTWFERALPLRENYLPLLVRTARRQRADGDIAAARATLFHALDLNDRYAFAHQALGQLALDENRLELAAKHLEVALESRPRFREALGAMADVMRQQGMADSAALLLARTADLPPKTELPDPLYAEIVSEGVSSFWCEVRGVQYMAEGRYDLAEAEFRRALTARENAEGYNNLGLSFQYQDQYPEAEAAFRQAIQHDSTYHDAWNNLGAALFRQDRRPDALNAVQRSLVLAPDFPDAYLNLGTMHKSAGRAAAARSAFRDGQRQAPRDPRFAYQLAWLQATSPDAAVRDGREAMRQAALLVDTLGHRSPAALSARAAALAASGRFGEAVKTAERALPSARRGDPQLAQTLGTQLERYRQRRLYLEPVNRESRVPAP